jgi:hypothetical protein
MFMYSYCYACSVLGIVFHCVVLCIVCVYMCTVLLPPGGYPIAVNGCIITCLKVTKWVEVQLYAFFYLDDG